MKLFFSAIHAVHNDCKVAEDIAIYHGSQEHPSSLKNDLEMTSRPNITTHRCLQGGVQRIKVFKGYV